MGFSVNLPAFSDLDKIINQANDPMAYEDEELIAAAAEKQVEKEKTAESGFWKFLEYLGRPQHAIAGVLKDMIDGGGFNPLDRIGQALGGKERIGIKDVIDEISPDMWSRVKLPEWMGGKRIDLSKEIVGFLGDVVTDPLMYVRIGSMLGHVAPKGDVLTDFSKVVSKSEYGQKGIGDVSMEMRKRGTATYIAMGQASHVFQMKKLREMFDAAMREPGTFAKGLKPIESEVTPRSIEALQKEFYDNVYNPFIKPGTSLERSVAAPTVGEQFRQGQRHVLSLSTRIPLVSHLLGLKENQIALIPRIVDELAGAGADQISTFFSHMKLSEAGLKGASIFREVFKSGPSDPRTAYVLAETAGKGDIYGKVLQEKLTAFQHAMGKNVDQASYDKVNSYLRHPHDYFGTRYRGLEKEPEFVQKAVTIYRDMMDTIVHHENQFPLLGTKNLSGPLSDEQAHSELLKMIKKERPDLAFKFSTLGKLKRTAKKIAKKKLRERAPYRPLPGFEGVEEAAYDEALDSLLQYEMAKGAKFLNSTIPYKETGYMPRRVTPEVEAHFQGFIHSNNLNYGGVPFYQYLERALRKRKGWFRGVDASMVDEAWRKGEIPVDVWDVLSKQAAIGLKGAEKKSWEKWLGALDNDQRNFYIDDPGQAAALRAFDSIRATSNADAIQQAIRFSSVRVNVEHINNPTFYIGNDLNILSPKGMEAMLGREWRSKLGDEAAAVYDTMSKELRLRGGSELQSIFLGASDMHTYALAASNGIPVYATPKSIVAEMNKVMDAARSPDAVNKFLRLYDDVTNFWKASTLAIFPAYHARNIIGQFWMGYLAGTHVEDYVHASKFLFASGLAKEGWPVGRQGLGKPMAALKDLGIQVGGRYISGEEFLDLVRKMKVMEGTMRHMFVEQGKTGFKALSKAGRVKKGLELFTHKGVPIKAAFNLGNMFEAIHRLALFRRSLLKGMTPFEARGQVVKYFFDYEEMSRFDRAMVRAFPFWRWTRNNVPLQVEQLVRQPGKAANLGRFIRWFQSDDGKNFDRSLLPKWANEQYGVPLRINRGTGDVEVFILRSWIPAMDAMAVVSENPIHSSLRTLGSLAHPLPKGIIEAFQNRSFYSERAIEEFPGEPVPGGFMNINMSRKMQHTLKSMPFGRLMNEIDKMMRHYGPAGTMGLSQRLTSAAGITPKIKSFNVDRLIKSKKFDINMRKAMLKRKLNRAKKMHNPEFVQYFKDLLEDAGS